MKVYKRDGRLVPFNKQKIINAINKAFKKIDGNVSDYSYSIANYIANYIESLNKDFQVEEIQNLVENELMKTNRPDIAKEYIIYRNDRCRSRDTNSGLMKEVANKIMAKNVENQNANVDEKSFGGRIGAASDAVMKQFALDNCVSDLSRNNHLNNQIYIHDLSAYASGMHNCLSIPFDDLLNNGFNTRQTDVRAANSINTAFQLIAVIFQLQSLNQFGGVSATHLDWTMVPFVRISFYKHYKDGMKFINNKEVDDIDKEKIKEISIDDKEFYNDEIAYNYAINMTEREVHQSVEAMYHNLNTLQSRSGNQLDIRGC